VGASLSFTAKVTGTTTFTPSGTVTLMDGTTSLGQQSLDFSGQAVFSAVTLAAGQHSLSLNYSGDSHYLSTSSAATTQSITDFQISVANTGQIVAAGGMATYNLTITPVAGFAGSLTLTCSQLPALTSCNSLTVPVNGQVATTTLNVQTTAPVRSQHVSSVKIAGLGIASVFLFLLLPRRRTALQVLTGLIAFTLTGFIVACSSGGGSSPVIPGTPSGSTSFTITASLVQGGQTLTHTTNATLIVQ
jgi:hypothetical protein